MPSRYQNEPLITLAEAKGGFGYTSDHLAYLCRNGFLWGQCHGRLWLTCGKAVMDYKRRLKKFGKPTRWENLNRSTTLDFLAAAPGFGALVRFFCNALNFAGYLGRLYKSIFRRKRLVYRHIYSRPVRSGFSVGETPFNLPSAFLPKALRLAPWYREKLVVAPFCLLLLGISCFHFSGSAGRSLKVPWQFPLSRFESGIARVAGRFLEQNVIRPRLADPGSLPVEFKAKTGGLNCQSGNLDVWISFGAEPRWRNILARFRMRPGFQKESRYGFLFIAENRLQDKFLTVGQSWPTID